MSLPGDKDIDTDPAEELGAYERLQDVCDHLDSVLQALIGARRVLDDPDASPAAQGLAERTLREKLRGAPTLVDNARRLSTRLQEEIDTLSDAN
jgi:hypothetical protein